jgi:diguanylate cyclase (GGDEF)-like protein
MLTDITRSKMHEAFAAPGILEAWHASAIDEVLELVCQEVERIAPEVTASVLEVDAQDCCTLAGASLPQSYSQLLDGLSIGPPPAPAARRPGATHRVVDNIAQDPLWKEYRHLVLPLGYQACWSTPIRNSQHQPIGTFALFREPRAEASQDFHQKLIDACTHLCALALERESDRHRIRQLAFYDGLTGMPNRALLRAKADQAIASAARNHEQLAVLFIDLDRFKQVNDSLGHGAGDELLRTMAARLQQVLRANDIVGRLSGDEFAAVLTQCDADHATSTIERLQVLLAEPLTIKKTSLTISASIGISSLPADGQDLETLLQHADMAMYQAKSTGRGRFCFSATK